MQRQTIQTDMMHCECFSVSLSNSIFLYKKEEYIA